MIETATGRPHPSRTPASRRRRTGAAVVLDGVGGLVVALLKARP